jgi:hypothetical protein
VVVGGELMRCGFLLLRRLLPKRRKERLREKVLTNLSRTLLLYSLLEKARFHDLFIRDIATFAD